MDLFQHREEATVHLDKMVRIGRPIAIIIIIHMQVMFQEINI